MPLLPSLTSFLGKLFLTFSIIILPHNSILNSESKNFLLPNIKKIKEIVIIGPNHQNIGPDIIDCSNNNSLCTEYSVHNFDKIIPSNITKKYFLFRRTQKIDELYKLADTFKKKGTLLISSADFAHYTDESTALSHDMETFQLIKNKKYLNLNKLDDSYTDCPSCLVIASYLSSKTPVSKFHKYLSGTSYFIIQL